MLTTGLDHILLKWKAGPTLALAVLPGLVLSGQFCRGSGELLLSRPQMLHPGPETANHILLSGTVTAACCVTDLVFTQ